MILITKTRTVRAGSAEAFAEAQERFARSGYLKLAGLLEPTFLGQLLDALDEETFYERLHEGIGAELCVSPGPLTSALELAFNDPTLLATISELTGCGSVGCFEGRVYRMAGGAGHYDSWHSDVGEDRLVALSVNLGRERFEGGVLQIRRADSLDVLSEVENPTPGDAVIFRIDPAFRHRVGPIVRGTRTAYAGWFRSQPEYAALLRQQLDGQ